jgi:hypothetical protein
MGNRGTYDSTECALLDADGGPAQRPLGRGIGEMKRLKRV